MADPIDVNLINVSDEVFESFIRTMTALQEAGQVQRGNLNNVSTPEEGDHPSGPSKKASVAGAGTQPRNRTYYAVPDPDPAKWTDEDFLTQYQLKQDEEKQAAMVAQARESFEEPSLGQQAIQKGVAVASKVPGVGGMINSMTDDKGFFRMENVGQAVAFAGANALMNNAGQALGTTMAVANPLGYAQQGMNNGLAGGDVVSLGPFGFRNPFGGEAFSRTAEQAQHIIGTSFEGGINLGQAANIGQRWMDHGWLEGSHDFNRLREMEEDIQKAHPELQSVLDSGAITSLLDQMMRHGTTSQKDATDAIDDLATAARGARVPLEDMVAGVTQVAEKLSSQGLTFTQGAQAAIDFTSTTGQHPEVMSMLMDNPMWQTMAMGETQIPVEMQGLLAQQPGVFNQITGDMLHQMRRTLGGVPGTQTVHTPGVDVKISSRRQTDAAISQATGLPIDTLRDLEKNSKTIETQGYLKTDVKLYDRELNQLRHQFPDQSNPEFQRRLRQLDEGTGRYAGQAASLQDLETLASKPKSGISPEQWQRVQDADPVDRRDMLERIINQNAPDRIADQKNRHMIGFTGLAEKMLKEVLPGYAEKTANARKVRRGEQASNSEYLNSGQNSLGAALDGLGNLFPGGD